MRFLRAVFGLLAAAAFALAQTPVIPSVDSILAHFVTALGGQVTLEKIKTLYITGTLDIPGFKSAATTSEYFQYPNRFAAITDIPGYGAIRTIYDGKTAWQVDPQRGVNELSGPELADISRRADIHWNLKLKEFYPDLHVKGQEKVNGKDAWRLEATLETWKFALFFDVDSGLLVRFDTDRHTSDGPSSVAISDYRPVDDSLFAYTVSMSGPGIGWTRKLTTVKFNTPIDDSVFSKPSKTP